MEIRKDATVITKDGAIGTVLDVFTAINGKCYAEVHITGAAKYATRKILVKNLTVLDRN